jgi:putative protein-disulfide isomerase
MRRLFTKEIPKRTLLMLFRFACVLCLSGPFSGIIAQSNTMDNQEKSTHPLLCDPVEGICVIPGQTTASPAGILPFAVQKPLKITYFTDPICSTCWGVEPQLRRLKLEYGHLFDIEYHMGGLLPGWDGFRSGEITKPEDVSHHWEEVSAFYRMPIDGDVWLEDPLPSSYPPSIAFKSAELQDHPKALRFLRELRQMVFLQKKNICRPEHLRTAAQTAGLDPDRLFQDMEGTGKQAFMQDLELSRQLGVRGFPTFFITDAIGNRQVVYGFRPYEQFEAAIRHLQSEVDKQTIDTAGIAPWNYYPAWCTQEYAVLCGISHEAALKVLAEMQEQGKIKRTDSKNGPIWTLP